MAAYGTLIGDQLAHCAKARHLANRHRTFAQTATIVGQFPKLRQNTAHAKNDIVQGEADNSGKSLKGVSLTNC